MAKVTVKMEPSELETCGPIWGLLVTVLQKQPRDWAFPFSPLSANSEESFTSRQEKYSSSVLSRMLLCLHLGRGSKKVPRKVAASGL